MVRDIFDSASVAGLKGWMGVGHGMSMSWSISTCTGGCLMSTVLGRADVQCDTPPLAARLTPRRSRSTSTRHTVSSLATYVSPASHHLERPS